MDGNNYGEWDTRLLNLVQSYDWPSALSRILSHPGEAKVRGPHGRTALHIACDHDAPAVVVDAILKAYPEAASMVGTSNMNPLHITCSGRHASVQVVKVLLSGSLTGMETSMCDVDGDTPLHAACRCGAPIEVLEVLMKADPSVVGKRDHEGLTPILRLWVRYFVTLGDDFFEKVKGFEDITGELEEAWLKTILLLRCAYYGNLHPIPDGTNFSILHAASLIDCPRAVLNIAITLYPDQLEHKDEFGRMPLHIACAAPIYKVHDLSEDGYSYELFDDVVARDTTEQEQLYRDEVDIPSQAYNPEGKSDVPSVVETVLQARPSVAAVPDRNGRLPLNLTVESGKCWFEGVKLALRAYPEALSEVDTKYNLYPFMAAAIGEINSLTCVYELLRADPELVRCGITSGNSVSIIHESTVKKEKPKESDKPSKNSGTINKSEKLDSSSLDIKDSGIIKSDSSEISTINKSEKSGQSREDLTTLFKTHTELTSIALESAKDEVANSKGKLK